MVSSLPLGCATTSSLPSPFRQSFRDLPSAPSDRNRVSCSTGSGHKHPVSALQNKCVSPRLNGADSDIPMPLPIAMPELMDCSSDSSECGDQESSHALTPTVSERGKDFSPVHGCERTIASDSNDGNSNTSSPSSTSMVGNTSTSVRGATTALPIPRILTPLSAPLSSPRYPSPASSSSTTAPTGLRLPHRPPPASASRGGGPHPNAQSTTTPNAAHPSSETPQSSSALRTPRSLPSPMILAPLASPMSIASTSPSPSPRLSPIDAAAQQQPPPQQQHHRPLPPSAAATSKFPPPNLPQPLSFGGVALPLPPPVPRLFGAAGSNRHHRPSANDGFALPAPLPPISFGVGGWSPAASSTPTAAGASSASPVMSPVGGGSGATSSHMATTSPDASPRKRSSRRHGRAPMTDFPIGTIVTIRPAAYHGSKVRAKLRGYYGQRVPIVRLPVYPDTWFAVKLGDKDVKVRSSAFYRPEIDGALPDVPASAAAASASDIVAGTNATLCSSSMAPSGSTSSASVGGGGGSSQSAAFADAVQFGDTRPRKRSRTDHSSTLPPLMPAEREPSSLLLNNSTTAVPLPKDPALYEPYKKGTFYCVCRSTHTSRRIFSRHQAQCDLWKKFLLMHDLPYKCATEMIAPGLLDHAVSLPSFTSPSIEASIASRPSLDDAFDVAMNLTATTSAQKSLSSPQHRTGGGSGRSSFVRRGQSASPPPQHAKNIRDPLLYNGGAGGSGVLAAATRSRGSSVYSMMSEGTRSGLSTSSDADIHFNQRDPMIPFSGSLMSFSSEDSEKMTVVNSTMVHMSSLNGENDRQSERSGSMPRFSPGIGPEDIPTLDMSELSPNSTPKSGSGESLVFEVPTPKRLRNRPYRFTSPEGSLKRKGTSNGEDVAIRQAEGDGGDAALSRRRRQLDMIRPRSPVPPPSLENIFTSSPETLISGVGSSLLDDRSGDDFPGSSLLDRAENRGGGRNDGDLGGQFQGFCNGSGGFSTDTCMTSDSDIFGVSSSASGGFQSSSGGLTSELPTPTLRPSPFVSPLSTASAFAGVPSMSSSSFTPLPAGALPAAQFGALSSSQSSASHSHSGPSFQPMSLLSAFSSSSSTDPFATGAHHVPPAPPISQLPLTKGRKLSLPVRLPPAGVGVGVGMEDYVLNGALASHCAPPPPPPVVC